MPLGNPEAYMAEGMPQEEAMQAAYPAGPPMGEGVPQAAPSPDDMMLMLIQAVMQKWGESQGMVDMEKQMLIETLMQLAQPAPPMGPQDVVEGAQAPVGMM